MTDQWDRFAAGADQTLDALGYDNNVELYEPTESYTQGEGYDISYPSTPTEVVSGETEPPSASSDTDRGGTTREADLMVYVTDDISTDPTDSGESGEALTRVEVDGTDFVYEVQYVEEQFDGMQKLVCSEVDT
jgi:hypothetical protein